MCVCVCVCVCQYYWGHKCVGACITEGMNVSACLYWGHKCVLGCIKGINTCVGLHYWRHVWVCVCVCVWVCVYLCMHIQALVWILTCTRGCTGMSYFHIHLKFWCVHMHAPPPPSARTHTHTNPDKMKYKAVYWQNHFSIQMCTVSQMSGLFCVSFSPSLYPSLTLIKCWRRSLFQYMYYFAQITLCTQLGEKHKPVFSPIHWIKDINCDSKKKKKEGRTKLTFQ